MGDPVETRLSEATKRPAAFDELGKSIQQIRKILELCAQKVKFSEENNDLGIWMKAIFAVMNTTWAVVKIRPEKNSGL